MNKEFTLHNHQSAFVLMMRQINMLVCGRGWGKSSIFGFTMHQIVRGMPGASGIITAKNISHVLTSILPSAFHHLERMGYMRDIHYVIGEKPPKSWGLPYEPPIKNFENYITFAPTAKGKRPTGFHLTSQERKGSGRGFNTDFSLTDETLRLNKNQLDAEQLATLRANIDKFKHHPLHRGQFNSTSMPDTPEGRWIIEESNYYKEDYGIDLWQIWRQIVNLQLSLLETKDPEEYARIWNEMQRLRMIVAPKASKDDKKLFVVGNAFDNLEFLKYSYIVNQFKSLPLLIFMSEILNALILVTSNAFYAIDEDRDVYYDSWSDDYAYELALSSKFDFHKLAEKNSAFLNRRYYDPNAPLMLFFDWGGTISFCLAAQYDEHRKILFLVKECYVLPPGEMPKRLMKEFCKFFEPHKDKRVFFLKDTLGDDKSRSIQGSTTINEDAISELKKSGWTVLVKKHKHKEPPMYEKWQAIQKIFSSQDPLKVMIDGYNCRFLVLSMKATKTKQDGNVFSKDKSLERKKDADQREATHSTDAFDKGVYYIIHNKKKAGSFYGTI